MKLVIEPVKLGAGMSFFSKITMVNCFFGANKVIVLDPMKEYLSLNDNSKMEVSNEKNFVFQKK